MTVTAPLALLLLLTLPAAWWIGRPRGPLRRGRAIAALVIRTAILLCLILALAGAQIVRAADRVAVVFLADASDSMPADAREAQQSFITQALAGLTPGDQAAVVLFGAEALIERPLSAAPDLAPFRSTPVRGASDIEEAISLGLALFPPGAARRLVLLSDGLQTRGDALAAAERAAALGIPIDVVDYASAAPRAEVRLADVFVPEVVNAGERFDVLIDITADAATAARLSVFAGGALVGPPAEIALEAGQNRYVVTLEAGDRRGFTDVRALVEPLNPADDAFYQNNQLTAFTRVDGPARALILASPGQAGPLAAALTAGGITVEVAAPAALPIGLAPLAAYDAVILHDVPASALSPARMDALETFVRDLGGGLVMVGGPDSYAPGGYFNTPIEAALPVEMRLRDQQRVPQVTLVYVIDRSGSMLVQGPSGVSNLDLAKEAINRSIDFLQPTDRAGIVTFDVNGLWVAQLKAINDKAALQSAVAGLQSGGGTDIMAGYRLAGEALIGDEAARRHIVLLTDGGANDSGLVELAAQLNDDHGITTSVIGIGVGMPAFLSGMAASGGGNYHAVDVIENIPLIFSQETVLATRAYYVEETFTPVQASASSILTGLEALPPLRGYVATTARETARVLLRGPEPYNDPILAEWTYGLGRSIAFTSDAVDRWASSWVAWDGFPTFWAQVVAAAFRQADLSGVETRVIADGEQARVVAEARTADNGFLNGLSLQTRVTGPDGTAIDLPLRQVAPGRYEASFTPGPEGAYFVRTQSSVASGTPQLGPLSGWVNRYSAEYNGGGIAVLADVARISGGAPLLAPEGPQVFTRRGLAQDAEEPLAPALLLLAALLLPLDIAVRRLLITRSDVARAWAALRPRRSGAATDTRMASLLEVKERARAAAPPPSMTPPPTAAPPFAAPPPTAQAPTTAPPPESPPPTDGNLAGRLLQRRRDRE